MYMNWIRSCSTHLRKYQPMLNTKKTHAGQVAQHIWGLSADLNLLRQENPEAQANLENRKFWRFPLALDALACSSVKFALNIRAFSTSNVVQSFHGHAVQAVRVSGSVELSIELH